MDLFSTTMGIVEANVLKNDETLVLKYEVVNNDGFKLTLDEGLKLEQVGHSSF